MINKLRIVPIHTQYKPLLPPPSHTHTTLKIITVKLIKLNTKIKLCEEQVGKSKKLRQVCRKLDSMNFSLNDVWTTVLLLSTYSKQTVVL